MKVATIFERYGGFATIRRIVSDFYDRILETPSLEHYFVDIDLARLIDHQTKFISTITGGPANIGNEQIRRGHASLGITTADFRTVVKLLSETLEDHNMQPEDIAHVIAEVNAREAFVVTRS